jgi:hypothetical protein
MRQLSGFKIFSKFDAPFIFVCLFMSQRPGALVPDVEHIVCHINKAIFFGITDVAAFR